MRIFRFKAKCSPCLYVTLFFQAATIHAACFDFTTPIKTPMHKLLENDTTEGGDVPDDQGHWGAARGEVTKPIDKVFAAILDPSTIKDPEKSKVKVIEEKRPGFLRFQFHEIQIKPFPLITIEWTETWAFVLADGKENRPKKIVISYEKTDGTSHIKNYCGSIVLTAKGRDSTDVFLYEQIKASGRSSKEVIEGHLGTLRTLRK